MSSHAPVPEGLSGGLAPLYQEAMAIADQSPASACALLRLVMRSVLTSAGQTGRDLGRDIETATLGAPPVLRALDAIGLSREASRRPGEIDLSQGHSDVQIWLCSSRWSSDTSARVVRRHRERSPRHHRLGDDHRQRSRRVWALAASRLDRLRGRPLWTATIVAELLVFAQAGFGVWLMNIEDLDPPQFHLFYGFTAIIAVGILYSYRSQLAARVHVLYGFGGLFIMGLGLRSVFIGTTGV